MIKEGKSFINVADSMILIGIALGSLYWMLESLLMIFYSKNLSFSQLLFGQKIDEIWTRLIVLVLFIFFGGHVQSIIKARMKAEDALRTSEEKYRNILETMEEGYYELDLTYKFTFSNDSMAYILEHSKDELLGVNIKKFMEEDMSKRIFEIFDEIYKRNKVATTFDCEFVIEDNCHRDIEASVGPLKDGQGAVIGYRGVVRDTTEKKRLEKELARTAMILQKARGATILGLAKLAEFRDTDTGDHLERIRDYSRLLAAAMSGHPKYEGYISREYIDDIYNSSILHDIGKVGIPDSLLLKEGSLDLKEFEAIKRHTILGGDTLSSVETKIGEQSFLTLAKEIAYYHHENWDGTGYPRGLRQENIPLSARQVALADVYDALRSKRPYKKAFSHEKAKTIILSQKGKRFDPDVVDAFLAQEENFIRLSKKQNMR